ncbi:hypothetical protein HUJ04_008849 [Dendroctonus ponderosae]|nr:hypothetical protein HUJ04_008849 [Dendroctonus ponderosae]
MVFRSMHPDDYVAPPFEPPMRIDCICTRCSCEFCNKEAPQQKSVAAQPSTNITTGAVMKKAVSVQQPAQMAGQQSTQIITGKESAAHGPGCMCTTCTCDPCKQDASKAALQASKSATGAKVEHPPGCSCKACGCDSCKYGGAAESFVSAKGSKPALGVGKSEAGPLHCNCPTCTCAEGKTIRTCFWRGTSLSFQA